MFTLFSQIRTGRKGQLATLFTIILIIFVSLAFISVNIGKIGLQRTRSSKGTTAGALAGGSAVSVILNYIANLNDWMVMNFLGFQTQLWPMSICCIIDSFRALKAIPSDFLSGWGVETLKALKDLYFSAVTLGLIVEGTQKIQDTIEKRINDMKNKSLSSSLKRTAMQYTFINAGIDEPKISYRDWLGDRPDTDTLYKEYLDIETEFSKFMRRNFVGREDQNDPNYIIPLGEDESPDNPLSFTWKDKRGDNTITQTVKVTLGGSLLNPQFSLPLERVDFLDIVHNTDGIRDKLKEKVKADDEKEDLGLWGDIVLFSLDLAPGLYGLVLITGGLLSIITTLLTVFAVLAAVQATIWTVKLIVSIIAGAPNPHALREAARYWVLTSVYTASAVLLGWPAYEVITNFFLHPIPCFLIEGSGWPELTLKVDLERTTTPQNIDYGLWQMKYPKVLSSTTAKIDGGKIFPPTQKFDVILIGVK